MKQVRLAVWWLKQKSKLLPVVVTIALVGTVIFPAAIQHTSAASSSTLSLARNSMTTVAAVSDDSDPCDAQFSNPLTWFVCPVIDMVNTGVTQMQNVIDNLLAVDVADIFDNTKSPGSNYYTAWNSFRLFGVVLIVIAGLVMIISQALGFEVFDAYTVKKVVPRLFIAAIGISLSWWLLKYLAQFTNDLGLGIRGIIYYPFRNMGDAGLAKPGGELVANIFAAGALWSLGLGGVLALVATAGLAALVAFIVLVIREIVIVFLILVAPLAIACYVLPNTERMYKLWWDSLSKGLLMFPIISGFIAVGRVFSVVANSSSTGGGVGGAAHSALNSVIALMAFFLPYFALPFTFRLAGGALATIGGLANDRSRGGFDRLKKYRGGKIAENMEKTKAGTRTNSGLVNGMTARATTRNLGIGSRGKAALNHKMDLAAMNEAKSPGGIAVQHNDDALRALTYSSANEARDRMKYDFRKANGDSYSNAEIENAIGAAKASGGFGEARQVYAAQALSQTGTGYDTVEQVAQTIARVSHGNTNQASSLAGNINSSTKSVGRFDLAPGFGQLQGLSLKEMQGGASVEAYHEANVKAAQGADPVSILRGKPKEVKNILGSLDAHARTHMVRSQDMSLKQEQRDHSRDEYLKSMGLIDQFNQSKSYASQENQEEVNKLLNNSADLRDHLSLITGRTQPTIGAITQAQAAEQAKVRQRANQTSAPRYGRDPDDPNAP
jgi:hypothetical protein